jgi:hypothetical protein
MTPRFALMLMVAWLTATTIPLPAQTIIDATGPVHSRLRNPTSGRAGSTGRRLPIQIALDFPPSPPNSEGILNVSFLLTNGGNKNLTIPISLNPGDLEPKDPKQSYSVEHLHLYVTSNQDAKSVLPGGADLYGSLSQPHTLLTLLPGKSARILIKVRPPREVAGRKGRVLFIGHAALETETLKIVDDQTFADSEEIGSATSEPYDIKQQSFTPK